MVLRFFCGKIFNGGKLMTILIQAFIIFFFSYIGTYISNTFNLVFPGSFIGLILMFLSLYFKIIKLKHIETVGTWLKDNMGFLFVPLTVGLMNEFNILKLHWFTLTIVMVLSTAITYVFTAKIVEKLEDHE